MADEKERGPFSESDGGDVTRFSAQPGDKGAEASRDDDDRTRLGVDPDARAFLEASQKRRHLKHRRQPIAMRRDLQARRT